MKTIPFFGAQREFQNLKGPIFSSLKKTYNSGKFLQGPEVASFEKETARLAKRKFGMAVQSCTDALFFALKAAGVESGDEVLVTDFSFVASASCILRANATPVFVDIGDDFNMSLEKAEAHLTKKTKALVWVHLYGKMGDPKKVQDFCQSHNLKLIEDTAQSFGATWGKIPAGSLGVASCVSFDPTKPISALGSGGVVLTDDEQVNRKVRKLRYHGKEQGEFRELGYNAQMPSGTAAILSLKLKKMKAWQKKRQQIAARYIKELSKIPQIGYPQNFKTGSHIFHKFVITAPDRDVLKETLKKKGIETFIHYGRALHQQPLFSDYPNNNSSYSNTIQATKEVLSLPIHPYLKSTEVQHILQTIKRHYS